MEESVHLAAALSSDDLVVSLEAKRRLSALLEPARLLATFSDTDTRTAAVQLLQQVSSVGDAKVFAVVGSALAVAFASRDAGIQLLAADGDHVLPRFLVQGLASADLAIASAVRPAVMALLRLLKDCDGAERFGEHRLHVASLLSEALRSDAILRLFDEECVDSDENSVVCSFLDSATDLIDFVFRATCAACDDDPLLVANYLVVSGVIMQHLGRCAVELVERVRGSLHGAPSGAIFCYACRFAGLALWKNERVAAQYSREWVPPAAVALGEACGEEAIDAAVGVFTSAFSTSSGTAVATAHFNESSLMKRLSRTNPAQRVSALSMLTAIAFSPFAEDALISDEGLREVWKLRTSGEPSVRVALWTFLLAVLEHRHKKAPPIATSCASFLAAVPAEGEQEVRLLHLRAVESLLATEAIPEAMKEKLRVFHQRGLYPPGHEGTEALFRR